MIHRLEEENMRLKAEFQLEFNNLNQRNEQLLSESNQKGHLLIILKDELQQVKQSHVDILLENENAIGEEMGLLFERLKVMQNECAFYKAKNAQVKQRLNHVVPLFRDFKQKHQALILEAQNQRVSLG